MRTALIAGASGLVGAALLKELLASAEYDRVVAVGRRRVETEHPKLTQVLVDFTALEQVAGQLRCDDAFCCLGTTIKQAGSKEAFRAVDHTAVLALAWAVQQQGATRFFVVSSLGADATSRVFYNRVKGEMEAALMVLGFATLGIFRPSLLLGRREQPRLGEALAAIALWFLDPLLLGSWRKYRFIAATVVARAMLRSAFGRPGQGVLIYLSDEIQDLGGFGH